MIFMSLDAEGEQHLCAGKLNLVDLAGSERPSKTGATGLRFLEGCWINSSLSALAKVMSALADSQTKHVPFRDSKLTCLLKDSLVANTRSVMIVCLSPADNSYKESINTLRFANSAKRVQNHPVVSRTPKKKTLTRMQPKSNPIGKSIVKLNEDIAVLSTTLETRLSSLETSRASQTHTSGNVETSFLSILL